jgi:cobalamin biosynthesis protein CobW
LQAKVPVTVVTGFLGAGKTSLVRHLVGNAGGRRLALVINEFGELGVDRDLLLGCGLEACGEEDIVELANGCICCTVADDFLPTMRRLLDRPDRPDHIIVETSGLALPKPLVKAFDWPEVRTRATVDGVVAVVDAEATAAGLFAPDPEALAAQRAADPSLDHESPLEELFEEQIACADLVLVNKRDRIDADGRAATEAAVRAHLRPGVGLVWTSHGALAPAVALGLGMAAEDDLASRPSHHDGVEHDHDDFESFALDLPPVADPAALEATLRRLAREHDILRIKGFAAVEDKPMRLAIQAVGDRVATYFDRPWQAGEERQGRVVVIGMRGVERGELEAEFAQEDAARIES